MNRRTREELEQLDKAYQTERNRILGTDEESDYKMEEPTIGSEPCQPTELDTARVEEQRVADYRVEITQVNNGFIVNVGCQTFVFEKFETASKYIAMYFENPSETTRKHYDGTLFK